jgi:hypothetical protein
MTTLRTKELLRDWIEYQVANHPSLDGIPIVINGETAEMEFPLIGIIDTGSEAVEQNGVIMHGVSAIGINVELHSVPVAEAETGTDFDDFCQMENDLYSILADRSILAWSEHRDRLRLFDIRPASFVVEPRDGRRVSVLEILCIACPTN